MASLADPSNFLIGAAMGYVHILGFLERAASSTHERDLVHLVLVALLALLAFIAYNRLAIAVFSICVAADSNRHRRIVIPELEQAAAALSPPAVLGWLGNLATRLALAVAYVIFGVVVYMIGNAVLADRN